MVKGAELYDLPEHLRDRIASLSLETRLLVEKHLTRHKKIRQDAIPRAEHESIPLTFSQERIWFLDRLMPGVPLYHIRKAFRLRGSLDSFALRNALQKIVARHEALRTRIVSSSGGPELAVDETTDFRLTEVDLSDEPEEERAGVLESILREEARRPFDLVRDHPLRATLLRLRPSEHVLLVVLHHIAGDRWSVEILLRELSLYYDAEVNGGAAELPELTIRYADFAAWQRRRLTGERLEELVQFWKRRLADAPALELPADRPHAELNEMEGGRYDFPISDALGEAVRACARSERATPYMVMLAAFKAWLHRSTGQNDLIVGSPIANRDRRELEPLIGMFVDTLVVRTDVSGNPTFRDLLSRVRGGVLEAFRYRDVPFEKLGIRSSQEHREMVRALFALQNTPEPVLTLPNIAAEPIYVSSGTAKFDLSLMIYDTTEGLSGSVQYNSALFEATTIERLTAQYVRVLEAAVADPGRLIGSLPMLSEAERHQMLVTWNRTESELPAKAVHELIERQAEKTPLAVAIHSEKETWTYSELVTQAGHLADTLWRRGAGKGSLVGVCMDREPSLIVTLLGILKAGAAYIPLDATYPAERLEWMVEDAKPQLVVTQKRFRGRFPERAAEVLCYEELPETRFPLRDSQEDLWEELAYVIYTSGSSGRPKGVMIEHRSLSNLTQQAVRSFELKPSDRVLQFASVSFDASAEEIFPTLAAGGAVVMCDPTSFASMADFIAYCRDHGITVLDLPTAFWHELVRHVSATGSALPDSVRLVIIGGEAARPEEVAAWFRSTDIRLVNTYGPTEATVTATIHELKREGALSRVPIGRPIGNTRAYVLDSYMNPVPPGVAAELYLGGAGIARGYLGRPDLTAERFIPNPFGEGRLYRTGDLVRLLDEGVLEFLGRTDDQVKIRGRRIEPGEIEAVMREDPAVTDAVVTACDRPGEGKRLVAYAAFTPQNRDVSALRDRLKCKLPPHLVPSDIVAMDTIPRLPGGKVDRQSLPAPERKTRAFIPPRSDVEKTLAGIWSELLEIPLIGAEDDFFDLGGHSLLAMRLVERVREAFSVQIPLRHLFDSSTLVSLSSLIETSRRAAPRAGEAKDRERMVIEI